CGGIIDAFGFVPGVLQSDSSLFGIRLVASLVPAVTFLVGVIALVFYPISKKVNEDIQVELSVRRAPKIDVKTSLNENNI
ncbi:hypothetical protein HP439_14485, partial [Sphingobacterium shayense]|uniref:MFS transporter n=1 Tax=Sphingobacterium shayense TaxID=626343 RepID=UPI001554CB7F